MFFSFFDEAIHTFRQPDPWKLLLLGFVGLGVGIGIGIGIGI